MELEVGALLLGSCFGSLYNNNHCSTHSSSNCSFRTKNNEQKPFVRVTTESSSSFINNQPKGLYRSQFFAIAPSTAEGSWPSFGAYSRHGSPTFNTDTHSFSIATSLTAEESSTSSLYAKSRNLNPLALLQPSTNGFSQIARISTCTCIHLKLNKYLQMENLGQCKCYGRLVSL